MGTKAEMVALIQSYTTNDDDDFVDHIPDFVRASEDRIWYFIEVPKFKKTVTGICAIGEEMLALPDDYLAMGSLWTTDTQFRPIDLKDETYLREVYPNQAATARPKVFAQKDDDTVFLAPVPDIAYPLQMTYYYKPPSLMTLADDAESWLSKNAFETLKFGALMEAGIYLKLEETSVYAEYEKNFLSCLTGLKNLGEVRLRKDINRGGEKRGAPQPQPPGGSA